MMAYRRERDRDEDEQLADALAAVASPVRLALLRVLREPRVLAEIEVGAAADSAWGDADRLLSRQTVKTHLARLVDVGAVSVREASRAGRGTVEYVLNHQALFALSEKFRSLALLRPSAEPDQATLLGEDAIRASQSTGPRLILVKGLDEGRMWRLDQAHETEWHLGRARHAQIRLDYDPFVSSEHARLVREDGCFRLEPAPASVNPTRVNFEPVRGAAAELADGDTIGVGRSILLFRERAARGVAPTG
jgi:DNA-binding transcriptional ArsR family regulator